MAAALYALLVAWTGGFDFRLGGARIRSTAWARPALAAAWALTAGLLFGTFERRRRLLRIVGQAPGLSLIMAPLALLDRTRVYGFNP